MDDFSQCTHLENDDEQIGLELSSSRGSSYNDLTILETTEVVQPALNTVIEEFMFENKLVTPVSPSRKLSRPISYSDSFLVLASTTGSINNSGLTRLPSNQSQTLLEPFLPRDSSDSGNQNQILVGDISGIFILANKNKAQNKSLNQNQNPEIIYKQNQLINKLISITVHISLISVFENIFFWQFISKSEDTALQVTIDGFLQTTLNQCNTWNQNTTLIIRDIFNLFINQTQIAIQANQALDARNKINYSLFVQSWLYYVGLVIFVILQALIVQYKKYKIKWKEVAIDNLLLVVLLGIYEYTFFKTIAMQYINISLPELENHIVNQLETKCNI